MPENIAHPGCAVIQSLDCVGNTTLFKFHELNSTRNHIILARPHCNQNSSLKSYFTLVVIQLQSTHFQQCETEKVFWSVTLLQVHFPSRFTVAGFLIPPTMQVKGATNILPTGFRSKNHSIVSFLSLSKMQHLSVTPNDIRTELQGKSPGEFLFKMNQVLSNFKSFFAQDSRRKARIILAYRIPQVSRQSQLYSPVWFVSSFNTNIHST